MKILVLDQLTPHKDDFSSQLDGRTDFELSYEPITETFKLIWNGLILKAGSNNDFIISGRTITINFNTFSDNSLVAEYFY